MEPDTPAPGPLESDALEAGALEPGELEPGARDTDALEPVVVPHTELSAELLHAVVESFVLREGTDYGEREFSLPEKVARVIAQLKKGEAKIVYDLESASLTILVR